MLSPYVIARSIYWLFPTATERLAFVATKAEVSLIAWQQDNDSLWLLKAAPNTWISIPTVVATLPVEPSNVITSTTTLEQEKSLTVVSYLELQATLNLRGNLMIAG